MNVIDTYLAEKGIQYLTSPEGIAYTVSQQGSGAKPTPGQYVKVHYTGYLLDGTKFDSSVDRGEPFTFQLGQGRVIKGWDLGIPLFAPGGKGTLYLTPDFGYGARGAGNAIPPNAGLIFEVELLEIFDQASYEAEQKKEQDNMRELLHQQFKTDLMLIQDYAQKSGKAFQHTEHGLHYHIETQGSGPQAEAGKSVSVHYTGKLLDGQVFDSSIGRGQPITFGLGQGRVIRGWDEGIALFREGGKGTLLIPSILGYGPQAMGPIPANSVLEFEIEVVKVG